MSKLRFISALENEAILDESQIVPEEGLQDLEEEVLEGSAQIAQESAEINTALDVVDGITDVATIVSEGEGELTDREVNLVRATANMAVAGTDADASDVIPGLESFTTRRQLVKAIESQQIDVMKRVSVGMESVMDRIKKTGQALLNLVLSEITITKKLLPALKALGGETKEVKLGWRLTVGPNGEREEAVASIFKNVEKQSKINANAASVISTYMSAAAKSTMSVVSSVFSEKALQSMIDQQHDFAKELVTVFDMKKKSGGNNVSAFSSGVFITGREINVSLNDNDKSSSVETRTSSIFDFLKSEGSKVNVVKEDLLTTVKASDLAKALEVCLSAAQSVAADDSRGFKAYLSSGGFILSQKNDNILAVSRGIREANKFASSVYEAFSFSISLSVAILKALRKVATQFV